MQIPFQACLKRLKFQHRKKEEREKREKHRTLQCMRKQSNNNSETPISQDIQSSESLLHQLHSSLKLPSWVWSDQSPDQLEKIVLCKISQESGSSSQPLTVAISLTINPDLTGHSLFAAMKWSLVRVQPYILSLRHWNVKFSRNFWISSNTCLFVLGTLIPNLLTCLHPGRVKLFHKGEMCVT